VLTGASNIASATFPRFIDGVTGLNVGNSSSTDSGDTIGPPLVITKFGIRMQNAAPAGVTYTFFVRKTNGTVGDTTATCTVPSLGTTCTFSGTVNTGAGDELNIHVTRSGSTATTPGWVVWSIAYS
jgi:hypothetical protein